jgi:AcrR family transcriptional regulator
MMMNASVRRSDTPNNAIDRAVLTVCSRVGVRAGDVGDVAAMAGVPENLANRYFPFNYALFDTAVRAAIAAHSDGSLPPGARMELTRVIVRNGDFPDLARLYHRRVLAPWLNAVRESASSTATLGEPRMEPLARFPELALAPGFFALIWNILLDDVDPLDEAELVRACGDLLREACPPPTRRGQRRGA